MEISRFIFCVLHCAIVSVVSGQFTGCDQVFELDGGGSTTIRSPNYPSAYPIGTNCRYQVTAPSFWKLTANCYVDVGYSGSSCGSNDLFRYIIDGTTNLYSSSATPQCGYYAQLTFTSRFNSLTFGITSSQYSGAFSCQITTSQETCDCGWNVNTKIYGGTRAPVNSLASMAALYSSPKSQVFCGGTLISTNCVLTAAHCVSTGTESVAKNIFVLAGRNDVTTSGYDTPYSYNYTVSSILRHQSYQPGYNNYDIALLFTQRKMAWNRGVSPICLPSPNTALTYYDNKTVTLSGWGTTSYGGQISPVLLYAQVSVYPLNSCQNDLSDDTLYTSQICTNGYGQRDSCQYDSGAPVLYYDSASTYRYFTIGIISYGPPCGVSKPAVNTRVQSYLSWIKYYAGTTQTFCSY